MENVQVHALENRDYTTKTAAYTGPGQIAIKQTQISLHTAGFLEFATVIRWMVIFLCF